MADRPAADLEREGHELLARGHAKLAEAARRRANAPANDAGSRPSWIPVAESPLGRRTTLQHTRTGEIESTKIGRKVLVRRSSLAAFLDAHRRDAGEGAQEDEDLFGAKAL